MTRIIYRIDDRLIHGQVIEGWMRNLNLSRVIIASDRIKKDEEYRKVLEFSVPPDIDIGVFGIEELSKKINQEYLKEEDTIILFESPADVLKLIDYGITIESVNVGCMHYDGYNRKLRRNIAASEKDIRNFEDINSMGTKLECRALPQDKSVDLMELLNKIK
ncbi:MAG: PTS system mannose/fructose/N-acetylgalactosamine-transporter subunit IIB [Elusimicrobiota bacterium]